LAEIGPLCFPPFPYRFFSDFFNVCNVTQHSFKNKKVQAGPGPIANAKAHLTPRVGSQSGRGTSAEARPANFSTPGSEGQIPAGEQLLDPIQVGQRMKLSPRTVSEMANDGRLPAYRIGIYLRFKWAEVERSLPRVVPGGDQGGELKIKN